jgi:UDP-GlcNAc:undecaprenyl-phosphate/decaprenyl-phosphate GlcNAc-1-phosphate transferase
MVWSELTDHLQVLYGAVAAFAIVLVLTPAVGRSARYLRLIERPHEGERARPTIPRLGGLALFLGVLVPSLAFLPLGGDLRGVLLGAAVATTIGAIDDFRHLNWWQKLSGQVLAGAIPTWFGVYVHTFTFPVLGIHQVPAWVGVPVTVLGIVAVMNMVNFLDGLDGLAAGVCAISGFTFAVIELSLGRPGVAILAAIVCGSAAASRSTSPTRGTCTTASCASASPSVAQFSTCGRGAARSRWPRSRRGSRRRTITAVGA